jgi:hypothetical protein
MTKTLPNLSKPPITVWQLLFVILPAWALSMVIITVLTVFIAINYVWRNLPEISIYSHRGADNDRSKQ